MTQEDTVLINHDHECMCSDLMTGDYTMDEIRAICGWAPRDDERVRETA